MDELKHLFSAIGFEGDPGNMDNVIQHLNANFVRRDQAYADPDINSAVMGKSLGSWTSIISRNLGDGFGKVELEKIRKENGFEGVLDAAFQEIGRRIETKEGEIKKIRSASKEGQSKQLLEAQSQIDDLTKSLNDYKEQSDELRKVNQDLEQNFNQKIKSYKIETQLKDIRASIPIADNVDNLRRKGFETEVSERFTFDLNDNDQLIVKDKQGHMIKNDRKVGEFLTPSEALTQLADKENILRKNDQAAPERRFSQQQATAPIKRRKRVGIFMSGT